MAHLPIRRSVKVVLTGKRSTVKECLSELDSRSRENLYLSSRRYECEESFTTLNVDIRNHQNLLDSLEQYVKGDLLEGANAYHCEKCNKKVGCLT